MPIGLCHLCICDICEKNRLYLMEKDTETLYEQVVKLGWKYKRWEGKEEGGLVSKIIYICPKCQEEEGT